MEFTTVLIAVLIVGLLSAMTADIILDAQSIWDSLDLDERGSGRVDLVKADLSWVRCVEDEVQVDEVDIIALAKSRQKTKPVVQAGVKVRQLLDNLGKLVDYSALTIRQLKAIAKQRGLAKYGSMRKVELIAALQSN